MKNPGSEPGLRCCPVFRSSVINAVKSRLVDETAKQPSKVLPYREITAAATMPPGRVTRRASARARIRSVRSIRW